MIKWTAPIINMIIFRMHMSRDVCVHMHLYDVYMMYIIYNVYMNDDARCTMYSVQYMRRYHFPTYLTLFSTIRMIRIYYTRPQPLHLLRLFSNLEART